MVEFSCRVGTVFYSAFSVAPLYVPMPVALLYSLNKRSAQSARQQLTELVLVKPDSLLNFSWRPFVCVLYGVTRTYRVENFVLNQERDIIWTWLLAHLSATAFPSQLIMLMIACLNCHDKYGKQITITTVTAIRPIYLLFETHRLTQFPCRFRCPIQLGSNDKKSEKLE